MLHTTRVGAGRPYIASGYVGDSDVGSAKWAMCRWTLGTVERRCGVLLDPNSGVVDQIPGSSRWFLFKPLPSEIATFFFFSNVSKHYFMRYAGSIDVRCVRTCVCNPAAVTAAEELHARSKGYSTSVGLCTRVFDVCENLTYGSNKLFLLAIKETS
jgi:hypothetical protein